jgi:hypothetical protein
MPRLGSGIKRNLQVAHGVMPNFVVALARPQELPSGLTQNAPHLFCIVSHFAPFLLRLSDVAISLRKVSDDALLFCGNDLVTGGYEFDVNISREVIAQEISGHNGEFSRQFFNRAGFGDQAKLVISDGDPHTSLIIPKCADSYFHGSLQTMILAQKSKMKKLIVFAVPTDLLVQ